MKSCSFLVVDNLFKRANGEKLIIEKTYVVGTHWNCLIEAIPICTYNIIFFVTENKEENY